MTEMTFNCQQHNNPPSVWRKHKNLSLADKNVAETKIFLISDGKLLIDLKADGEKGRWVTSSSTRVYWPPPASHTARLDSAASQHTLTGRSQAQAASSGVWSLCSLYCPQLWLYHHNSSSKPAECSVSQAWPVTWETSGWREIGNWNSQPSQTPQDWHSVKTVSWYQVSVTLN